MINMSAIYFCDVCNNKTRDRDQINMWPLDLKIRKKFYAKHLCNECVEEIVKLLKRRAKKLQKRQTEKEGV